MSMLLDRQTRHLILSYHFAPNAGLLNGKMGGVAFFGQYAKHTGKAYFREYAEELLDEVFDMVHEKHPYQLRRRTVRYRLGRRIPDPKRFVGRRFGRCAGGHR